MTQATLNIDPVPTSGNQLAALLNLFALATASSNSGTAAPTYAQEGCTWLDTTDNPYALKVYSGSVWTTLLTIHATTGQITVYNQGSPLGSAALLTAGIGALNLVQLDASAKLPAVDGSALINLPVSSGIPVGGLLDYAGDGTAAGILSQGYVPCNAGGVLSAAFPELTTVIGAQTFFKGVDDLGAPAVAIEGLTYLPDFRYRTAVGDGSHSVFGALARGGFGGVKDVTLTAAQIPQLATQAISYRTGTLASATNNNTFLMNDSRSATGSTSPAVNAGAAAAHTNMQPYTVVTKIIKAYDGAIVYDPTYGYIPSGWTP